MGEHVWLSGLGFADDCADPDRSPEGSMVTEPVAFTHAELRHATRAARLCGLAAERACLEAGRQPATLSTVFSSALGELEITDRLCTTLVEQPLELSPVLFHNSVHNTAAGYWAIAAQSRNPCRAVAAGPFSFAMGFLAALGQLRAEPETPVLYVYYEMTVPDRLKPVFGSPPARASAFVLESPKPPDPDRRPRRLLTFELRERSLGAAPVPADPWPPAGFGDTSEVAPPPQSRIFPLSEQHDLILHLAARNRPPA
jgi:hypothetical protein